MVGGDFNSVSRHWQLQTLRQYGSGDQIMEWANSHDMHLATRAGVPTHRSGNVLDLVWSNIPEIASVSTEINCTSDHMTIVGSTQTTKMSNPSSIL